MVSMSDSHLVNKIENLLKSEKLSIKDGCINITDINSKQLINFSLGPRRLDISYPSPISSSDLDVNGGEIERLYKTAEWIKWKYVTDFLNENAWEGVIYKPHLIDEAEKSLIHFVNSFNRVGDLQKGSWMNTSGSWRPSGSKSDADLLWRHNNVEIKINCYPTSRAEHEKKFFRKILKYINEETIMVTIKGISNASSSWTWYFTHENENRDALLEAIKNRQKAIVNYNLSSLTV